MRREQVQAVSLIGNVALGEDGRPTVHPHIAKWEPGSASSHRALMLPV
ncbi:MAG: hypothetical protein JO110_05190 [Acetobacteraceae bacterium]|nr:hypothetical protein [Acetobacteraceae bacterium]